MGHEKLGVYQRGLEYASWTHSILAGIHRSAAALDHWDRAAESIVENLANGNSRRSRTDRNRYFDVAIGSALECAACLDVCGCKKLVTEEQQAEGKDVLRQIVRMTIALRKSQSSYVREMEEPYSDGRSDDVYFAHENLDVYQVALSLVVWLDRFLRSADLAGSHVKRLDGGTTSLVLNIAEGNGRFSRTDQMRFLDIAHTSAMRVASCLDLLVARQQIEKRQVEEGKQILGKAVPLLLGLRGYLDQSTKQS
ncbi:MAG: four helix bundle protein [Candidatus Latescibacteria bacterium]|nr:four helix bundle protein [Candidatus Latescibacterota bacterium]